MRGEVPRHASKVSHPLSARRPASSLPSRGSCSKPCSSILRYVMRYRRLRLASQSSSSVCFRAADVSRFVPDPRGFTGSGRNMHHGLWLGKARISRRGPGAPFPGASSLHAPHHVGVEGHRVREDDRGVGVAVLDRNEL